jgi:nitrite reductase/ring-hydroxylating ferredoxin subunit
MVDCSDNVLLETWFPVATSVDLPKRQIFHAQLLGEELAIWRADDGYVNVWENRCLHRGVRLTLGTNLGNAVKCRYHGWLYKNRSATCTYIPAHPANAPATKVKATTYEAIERFGLLWVCLKPAAREPPTLDTGESAPLVLRSIPVRASAALVAEALMAYRFAPKADLDARSETVDVSIAPLDPFVLKGVSRSRAGDERAMMLFIQPIEQFRSVIHGLLLGAVSETARLPTLLHHNAEMKRVRDALEGSGRAALEVKFPAAGPAAAYRQLVAGKFNYGIVA